MSNDIRVVISGLGPMCSAGFGKDQLWTSVTSEKARLSTEFFTNDDRGSNSFYCHKLEFFNIDAFALDADILNWIRDWKGGNDDIDLFYLAAVSKLALNDSGLQYDPNNNSVGFVVAHENPGLETFFDSAICNTFEYVKKNPNESKANLMRNVYEKCAQIGYDTQTFMYLFFLAKLFSAHGFSLFVNNACASGAYAIEVASQQIREKRCSAVVVAGIDRQSIYKHWWLNSLKLYASDGLIKPFSKYRNGFVLGEGGAALVLESQESAEKRGANIYAEYIGGGFNLESGKVSLPSVERDFYSECISSALTRSKISPNDIDLINPHGIGTSITDLYEARAIDRVCAKSLVSAFKPYFGHNLGSCALLELCLLLLSLKQNYVPRTLNCEPIDEKIKINIAVKALKKELKTVMKLSSGFAGYNAAMIFRKIS